MKVWAVTTVVEAPYVMVRETSDSSTLVGNDRYEGYIVDLLSAIGNYQKGNAVNSITLLVELQVILQVSNMY